MPDLTELAAVKDWLAIKPTDTTQDQRLAALITSTSADFLRATARPDLLAADYTEPRRGDGGTMLALRHWPVNSIAALTIAGSTVQASPDGFQAGFRLDVSEGLDPERATQLYLVGGLSFTDTAAVAVTYNAGYAAVPADIDQAVCEWVAARSRSRAGTDLKSSRMAGGEHVEYDDAAILPANTARVIARYTRPRPSLDRRSDDRSYRITRISQVTTRSEASKSV